MFKTGQKVIAVRDCKTSSGLLIHKGTTLVVAKGLEDFFNRNKTNFTKLIGFDEFIGRVHPKEKARDLIGRFGKDIKQASFYSNSRQKEAKEFSESWQYWRCVSIILWRKRCGVSIRDVRRKPRMKSAAT